MKTNIRMTALLGLVSLIGILIGCPAMAQTSSSTRTDFVVIQSRTPSGELVIEDQAFRLTPDARILGEDGRPVSLDRISWPAEAVVEFRMTGRAGWEIQSLQLRRLPR